MDGIHWIGCKVIVLKDRGVGVWARNHCETVTFSIVHVSGFPRDPALDGWMFQVHVFISPALVSILSILVSIHKPLTCTVTHEQSSYELASAKIETATTETLLYVLHEWWMAYSMPRSLPHKGNGAGQSVLLRKCKAESEGSNIKLNLHDYDISLQLLLQQH